MILEAINDNIIVKLPKMEKDVKTSSGLIIGTNNEHAKSDRGTVVAVGKGRITMDGKIIGLTIQEGDMVIFNRFAGTEVMQGEDKFLIIKESDILARVK